MDKIGDKIGIIETVKATGTAKAGLAGIVIGAGMVLFGDTSTGVELIVIGMMAILGRRGLLKIEKPAAEPVPETE